MTCLALIASTSGSKPRVPPEATPLDRTTIDDRWGCLYGHHCIALLPLINSLSKYPDRDRGETGPMNALALRLKNFQDHCGSIQRFEDKGTGCWLGDSFCLIELLIFVLVKTDIRLSAGEDHGLCDRLTHKFRIGLGAFIDGLDTKKRKAGCSLDSARLCRERSLAPSTGTLIVVPQCLLEHWFEQIKRHLNLEYFTRSGKDGVNTSDSLGSHPGVVYMYGLGDIADIQSPLSKMQVSAANQVADNFLRDKLQHFMIVVTTFERCAVEMKQHLSGGDVPILQIRWLRLIVDEGHEIGQGVRRVRNAVDPTIRYKRDKLYTSFAESDLVHMNAFMSQVAAERRWIVSGTPTTGVSTEVALTQLHRLLGFLRHPLITQFETHNENSGSGGKKVKRADSTQLAVSDASLGLSFPSADPKPRSSDDFWKRCVIKPCLAQSKQAWTAVVELLKGVTVRHRKVGRHSK